MFFSLLFQSEIKSEVASVLSRTQYEIRGPKKAVAVDDESLGPMPGELPSPIAPVPAGGGGAAAGRGGGSK